MDDPSSRPAKRPRLAAAAAADGEGIIDRLIASTMVSDGRTSTDVARALFAFEDPDMINPASVQGRIDEWSETIATELTKAGPGHSAAVDRENALRFMVNARQLGDMLLSDRLFVQRMRAPASASDFEGQKPRSLYGEEDVDNRIIMCMNAIRAHAQINNLRKNDVDTYYTAKYTADGHFMNCHEDAGTIASLVSRLTNAPVLNVACDSSFDGVSKLASSIAKRAPDPFFPTLVRDKHVFSFSNGVVDCRCDPDDAVKLVKFHPYGALPTTLPNSASFREGDVDPEWTEEFFPPMDIPTPACDKILRDQGFDDVEISWVYALLGRNYYNVGELDDWQVLLYMHGLAGTGKSTMLAMCQDMYDPNDIYSIHTTFENQFGMSSIKDKYMWVAPDVKEVFPLDRALLQSMVSGEHIGVPVKYKTAKSEKWTTPGLMAGNRLPNYQDTAGSVARRIVLLRFTKVAKRDDSLMKRMKQEAAPFLIKCVRNYFDKLTEVNTGDVWDELPQHFKESSKFLNKHVNAAFAFINAEEEITMRPGAYVPKKSFEDALRLFARNQQIPLPVGISATLAEDLLRFDIPCDSNEREWPPGSGTISRELFFSNLTLTQYNHYFDK